MTAEEILQAIKNTSQPVINNSPKVYEALRNSQKETPHCECGEKNTFEPAKEQKQYGTGSN